MKADKITKLDKAKIGQFIGQIMKELKGKADGADVKVVVEKLVVLSKQIA
jgi:Asp-tRNA(Asn)/Glu-tRNA(Gln) amidotransferase B subunit